VCEGVDWVKQAQSRVQWQLLVYTITGGLKAELLSVSQARSFTRS
jgi:hypothetical protein